MKTKLYILLLFATSIIMSNGCKSKNAETQDSGMQKLRIVESDYRGFFLYCDDDPIGKFRMEYSSFEEAERKLIHDLKGCCAYSYVFFDVLTKIVKSDTSSISYPFDLLNEHYSGMDDPIFDFYNVLSQDGNLHIYSIDHMNGPCGNYNVLIQYRWNGKMKIEEYEDDSIVYGLFQELYEIKGKNATYYLIKHYSRGLRDFYCGYETYVLTEYGLKRIGLLKDSEGIHDYAADFAVKESNGLVYNCDESSEDIPITLYIYCGEGKYGEVNDRYYKYIWDGDYFVLKDDKDYANPYLYSQLKNYYSNEMLLKTDRNLIRIDLMPDKTYRYAAWKAEAEMSDAPELVINNGYMMHNDDDIYYIFNNEGFEYKVGDSEVVVRKGKNIVGRWYAYEIYSM